MRYRHIGTFHVAAAVAFLLAACAGGEAPPAPGPSTLQVTPAAGPPGTFVRITGLTAATLGGGPVDVSIGGILVPAIAREDGALDASLPPLLGAGGWHTPTAAPLDVVVERGGAVLGRGVGAVHITVLEPAPDAGSRLTQAWSDVLDGFDALVAEFPADDDETRQHWTAQLAALRELLLTGENALPRIFDGTAPLLEQEGELHTGLTTAMLVSSGLLAETEALADHLRGGADGLRAADVSRSASLICPYEAPDRALACKMQLYVVVKMFGETFVAPTAKTYGEITAVTGIVGIAMQIPAQAVVGFVLSVSDFVINKLVVALLPAIIDGFTLDFDEGTLVMRGEIVVGRVELTASNDPPPINATDILSLLVSAYGAAGAPSGKEKEMADFAIGTIEYFLGLYAAGFAAYSDAHPELNLSPTLAAIPQKTWGPTRIEYKNLFDAHSFTPAVLSVYEEPLTDPQWRASSDQGGEARVSVRTAGQEGKLIRYPGYTGGAFGEDVVTTETATICVDGPPELSAVASVSPTVIVAERATDVTFTLPWNDDCGNLATLHAAFDLDGYSGGRLQYALGDDPEADGFEGKEGTGSVTADIWVWCSEADKNPLNVTFYLVDEFSQASAERKAFVIVDYGSC